MCDTARHSEEVLEMPSLGGLKRALKDGQDDGYGDAIFSRFQRGRTHPSVRPFLTPGD